MLIALGSRLWYELELGKTNGIFKHKRQCTERNKNYVYNMTIEKLKTYVE